MIVRSRAGVLTISACFILWTGAAQAVTITSATLAVSIDGITMSKNISGSVTAQSGTLTPISFSQLFGNFIPSWATGEFFVHDVEPPQNAKLTKGIYLAVTPVINPLTGMPTQHTISSSSSYWNQPRSPVLQPPIATLGTANSRPNIHAVDLSGLFSDPVNAVFAIPDDGEVLEEACNGG